MYRITLRIGDKIKETAPNSIGKELFDAKQKPNVNNDSWEWFCMLCELEHRKYQCGCALKFIFRIFVCFSFAEIL